MTGYIKECTALSISIADDDAVAEDEEDDEEEAVVDKEGRVEKGNDGGALDALIPLFNIAIRKLCLPLDD